MLTTIREEQTVCPGCSDVQDLEEGSVLGARAPPNIAPLSPSSIASIDLVSQESFTCSKLSRGANSVPAIRGSRSPAAGRKVLKARPLVLHGEDVWPQHWGMTRQQLREFLHRLREDPAWNAETNVYELVSGFVVPWTAGSGLSYALSVNKEAPKQVNVMVSHAWSENAERFLETVIRSITEDDVVFICALSLYQPEDGAGPSVLEQLGSDVHESPFRRVLEHISVTGKKSRWPGLWQWHGVVHGLYKLGLLCAALTFYWPIIVDACVADFDECMIMGEKYYSQAPFQWLRDNGILISVQDWKPCKRAGHAYTHIPVVTMLFLASAIALYLLPNRMRIYTGRMLVVPNYNSDLYSRLWCVYEIYTAVRLKVPVKLAYTLASAGAVASEQATCSSPDDTHRIHSEIANDAECSFGDIDKAVYWVTRSAQWDGARIGVFHGVLLCTVSLASVQLPCAETFQDTLNQFSMFVPGFLITYLVAVLGVFILVARIAHGRPRRWQLWLCAVWLFLLAVAFRVLDRFVEWPAAFIGRGPMVGCFYLVISSFLARSMECSRFTKRLGCFPVLLVLGALGFTALLSLDYAAKAQGLSPQAEARWYPAIAKNMTNVASWFWGPAYVMWFSSVRWGVRVV